MSHLNHAIMRFILKNSLVIAFISSLMVPISFAQTEDDIIITGSTTVHPFAEAIAQRTKKQTGTAPIVEKTGSTAGIKAVCHKEAHIANASRRIKPSELATCQDNNIKLIEFWVGRDGIALTTHIDNKAIESLSRKQIYQATIRQLYIKGQLVANPYKKWSDISPQLPDIDIKIYGPPKGSGTRDAFQELALENSALSSIQMIKLYKTSRDKFNELASTLRDDGHYIEVPENDLLTFEAIKSNPDALAIFSYSYYKLGSYTLRAINIERVAPNVADILSGYYKMSRPLYFYVNENDYKTLPVLQSYVNLFIDKNAITGNGFLTETGLIPLSNAEFSIEEAKLSKNLSE